MGGNVIKSSSPVDRHEVKNIVDRVRIELPSSLLKNMVADIGSAGFKATSGDIDVMIEADDVVKQYRTQDQEDPVLAAKRTLTQFFKAKDIEAVLNGRNVSIGIPYRDQRTGKQLTAQVDVMVIKDVKTVAPWHQHGPRGSYDDSAFKGNAVFIVISSIAKYLGLKFDPFAAELINRATGEVVGRTRKQVAKILLGPKAKERDVDSVKSIVSALEDDPDREGKLAQARQDQAKGLITLPDNKPTVGTAEWFRSMGHHI